ncbi:MULTISPECIES: hypothetical protein [unclassified Paenibacillus]|uniref:hypothetical protein n=1 Tax=unclassified Paenibacillus TaxID=185978 RepID=UPI001C121B4D|nr:MULTISPECIES: hypothetical protein [unclassified Paenibacillus]MBU5445164.1 hypothetical protein [Paenibacillus sp. MSJ-34]CAH0122180.1 hypothetical protein PAE9249_04727 [Paenibacillus sp. CECT 9249]
MKPSVKKELYSHVKESTEVVPQSGKANNAQPENDDRAKTHAEKLRYENADKIYE